MSESDVPAAEVDWPQGYEGARIANLLHFADLTIEQRIQWLADMRELMQLARRAACTQPHDRSPNDTKPPS